MVIDRVKTLSGEEAMPFSLEKLPDLPVAVFIAAAGSDIGREMEDNILAINALLDEQPVPVFLIYDVRQVRIGVDDMLRGATLATRGTGAVLHHRNVRENLFVVTDTVMSMAVSGLASATFGQVRVG